MKTIKRFLYATLDTRITPLAYVYAATGFVWGFAFTFLTSLPQVQSSVLYQTDALIGAPLWGVSVLASTGVLFIGMLYRQTSAVTLSSTILFALWAAAAVAYALSGEWVFRFPLAILYMLCYGYYDLASALGRLWDYSP